MTEKRRNEAAIPNPALGAWGMLVGEWKITGTHRLMPDTIIHGYASITRFQGGAFLMMETRIEEEGFPSNIMIIGSDDAKGEFFLLYFDERGVSRMFETSLSGNVWKLRREAPGFSQRFTGTFADNGDTIIGVWELSEDDATWKRDLEMKYTRVKA